jgi:signal transduction histidine kinase
MRQSTIVSIVEPAKRRPGEEPYVDLQRAAKAAATRSGPRKEPEARLRYAWLLAARAVCVAIAVLALVRFAAAVPSYYAQLSDPAETVRIGLAQLGISAGSYATFRLALAVLVVVVYYVVAGAIFWRKSGYRVALFVSLFLTTFGVNAAFLLTDLAGATSDEVWLFKVPEYTGWVCVSLFFYLFPDGRFTPRWTRALAVLIAVLQAPLTFIPDPSLGREAWWNLLLQVLFLGIWGSGLFAQVYRYRYVSGRVHRQQTKWVVFGAAAAITGIVGAVLPGIVSPSLASAGSPYALAIAAVGAAPLLFIPLTIGIAILRHHLWDIDVIINRTLVYGALTAGVAGLYIVVVGYLGAVFRTGGNLVVSLVAASLVAVLFQPLRVRLQRGVNRLMYGERDDPYAVLSRLGERLKVTDAPEAMLPAIAETAAGALKLPHAAISLRREDGAFETVAATGRPEGEPLVLPLSYGTETLGRLILSPRAPGEPLGAADRRTLDGIARHAEAAAYAVRLTADLQRSRERLVNAREEERRRLRRDLHDGLGPQLATLTLKLDAARNLLGTEPQAADTLLAGLKTQVQAAISDIRHLVYDLRPPALDELGLIPAIREGTTNYSQNGLSVFVEVPRSLPPLPAAVEVAAYRIVQEALTNVVRHAKAQACRVRLSIDHELELEIIDDGVGLPEERHAGVGLSSIRERAAELGGTCLAESLSGGGTRVLARLPLPDTEASGKNKDLKAGT